MDRTSAITRLNTEEIATEVNNVIKKGLDKLLGNYLYRYELLEKTHDAIMNLPNVRHHLNQEPLPPQQCENNNNNNVKYDQMIEKLLKRIDELTFEVNQLKQTCKKEYTDIKVEDELKVVKLEQKENIRLEIEEEVDDDASSCEAEEEEEEEDDESSVLSKAEGSSEAAEEDDANEAEEENICSECDCKVILDEDIIVVDGKKYCGACDPTSTKEEEADDASEAVEEEEVVVEEEEEEADDASEAVEEEEEVVDEEVVEEVVVEEEAADEVETEKSESEAEEEEEFIEIDIDDVTYCTNNEENGFIYELTEDGDVGEKVGYLKDGEPFFYADEK
jgi:hypothetical protein